MDTTQLNQSPPEFLRQDERPLVVAHVVEVCYAGLATFTRNLIQSQLADPAIGAVHLIADPGVLDGSLTGLTILHPYESSRNPLRTLTTAHAIELSLEAIAPDIVLLHSTFPGLWGRLRKRAPWKRIYCAHGWAFTQNIAPLTRLFYERVEAILSRRCDAVVSISHDEFNRSVAAGVRAPLHEIIHHGVMPSSAGHEPILDLAPQAIHLAFLGRFDRQKGIDILFKIFEDRRLDYIHVWLVGRAVHAKDGTLPSRPNFHLLGWRRSEEVDAILSQVDGLIMPSRWEGFGLSALEAMRNARPVIANRVGGLAETVTEGLNGRFIDIRDIDACRQTLLALDKAGLARMGAQALQVYREKFTWERNYLAWRKLVARVMGRPCPKGAK